MNKVKKFEISVVDRTYSRIVSNLVKFYSSDSALEVIFILAEEGYEFDSAELVLSNNDGSLITRPLTKVPEGYSYEFEKNIITHHGEWKGQVILHSVNDSYVSSKVVITIEDDLLSERPPKLTDVYSWTSLKRYADKLTDDLKQAVLSIEGVEDTFNENELERQTAFDGNEANRAETFNTNEATRQENETTRQQAESQRQSTFETNETERQSRFESAENGRVSAESSRVSAEEQRKNDHANRSAELDGKVNKKQEGWKIPTLLNGFTGDVAYRKTEFDTLDICGIITSIEPINVAQLDVFKLPSEYAPTRNAKFDAPENVFYTFRNAKMVFMNYYKTIKIYSGQGASSWYINVSIPIK